MEFEKENWGKVGVVVSDVIFVVKSRVFDWEIKEFYDILGCNVNGMVIIKVDIWNIFD